MAYLTLSDLPVGCYMLEYKPAVHASGAVSWATHLEAGEGAGWGHISMKCGCVGKRDRDWDVWLARRDPSASLVQA